LAKIQRSYRFNEKTIERLEKLAAFYSLHSPARDDLPGQGKKVYQTDILEFLVNSTYEKLKEGGYTI
jgi:hypothetical protein